MAPAKKKENLVLKKRSNLYLIEKHKPLYEMISQVKGGALTPRQRSMLIDSLNKKQINGIKILMNNFLKENYKIPPLKLKQLAKDRQFIYKLSAPEKTFPSDKKRKLLKQKGGILGAILPLAARALPMALGALSSVLNPGGQRAAPPPPPPQYYYPPPPPPPPPPRRRYYDDDDEEEEFRRRRKKRS